MSKPVKKPSLESRIEQLEGEMSDKDELFELLVEKFEELVGQTKIIADELASLKIKVG